MRVIAPLQLTDAMLVYSNVPETDAPEWAAGTTYAAEATVMVASVHRLYESAKDGNLGHNPVTDDGTNWIELGATNRWRAFDQRLTDVVSQLDTIVYEIVPPSLVSGIGFLNTGASSVLIEVLDTSGNVVYTKFTDRYENTAIVDYWSFFTTDLSDSEVSELIVDDILGYPGNKIRITLAAVNADSVVSVGQIVFGTAYRLGETTVGTSIGIKDFSSKGRDQFGAAIIVQRPFADTVNFTFELDTKDARRIRTLLARQRAIPSLYYAGVDLVDLGTQTYGFFIDFEIPLSNVQKSFATLRIEGLV